MINNISFKAKYIRPVTVKQIGLNNYVKNKDMAFVELDCFSKKDCLAATATSSLWESGDSYASNIAEHISDCNWIEYTNGKRFFAITQQKENFENLNPEEILALAEVIDMDPNGNSIKLSYLQVDPDNNHYAPVRSFKKIGSGFIDSLKKIFEGKKINLIAANHSGKFYESNGFKAQNCYDEYTYTPNN